MRYHRHFWIYAGLGWGVSMLLFSILADKFWLSKSLRAEHIVVEIVIWAVMGLVFGYLMKLAQGVRGSKDKQHSDTRQVHDT